MKKKTSYIYEISVENLEISERMRYYSTKKDAIEVALKLGKEVFNRIFGYSPVYNIEEEASPICITLYDTLYTGQKIRATVKRIPVNETIKGKEIKIYWD